MILTAQILPILICFYTASSKPSKHVSGETTHTLKQSAQVQLVRRER